MTGATRPRVWLLDHHDSFTWNVADFLTRAGADVVVRTIDEVAPESIATGACDAVVLSPGPGRPEHTPRTGAVLRVAAEHVPVLGVCLGHQAIGYFGGARLVAARRLVHGKTSDVFHDGRGVFDALPSPLRAARYHSLALARESLPDAFGVSAWTSDGEVMAIRHRALPIEGVQFHPESILSEHGVRLFRNFLSFRRFLAASSES